MTEHNYIFFDSNIWKLHPGELPVKPSLATHSDYNSMEDYNQAIADIKSKALVVENPEIFSLIERFIKIKIECDGFYQWPGSYEKEIQYPQGIYFSGKEVTHLVLPEEKNVTEPTEGTGEKILLHGTYDQLLETCKELEIEIDKHKVVIRNKNEQITQLKASLGELIPIAERLYYLHGNDDYVGDIKSAIERAKKLIDVKESHL